MLFGIVQIAVKIVLGGGGVGEVIFLKNIVLSFARKKKNLISFMFCSPGMQIRVCLRLIKQMIDGT